MKVLAKDGGQSNAEVVGKVSNPGLEEQSLNSTEKEKIDEGT